MQTMVRVYISFPRLLASLVSLAVLLLCGCETVEYYAQAASGQWRLLSAREPIEEVVAAPQTGEKLREQLRQVQNIRAYAKAELRLPVGRAYGAYVQLEEDYPVWNVLAAPEFSLTPKRWCYPVVGCASYRGYFHKAAAEEKARELLAQGYDVYLGPVPAYSTLGWFDDPVLSSFVHWSPERLAGLLFHELAHRRVYISGDTQFNESFATAVSELALPEWRRRYGIEGMGADTRAQALAVNRLMTAARKQLQTIYKARVTDESKRAQKAQVLSRLRHCYRELSADWPNPERYRRYIDKTNNATLALVAEYQSQVPAFKQLYRESDSWEDFYRAAERLGELGKEKRKRRLKQLAQRYKDSSTPDADSMGAALSPNGESCMRGARHDLSSG
ncbi:aminopeptidase [Microbulbifer thermotolerans]|uniref:aminopeptidase n=1 Tax=Microbulbifer thermotolerans TaxID=252514 RepID=UPI0009EE1F1C|nr:aminopeptidase [Microbulbifer thermotolerans]MCX2830636.1 aminopeptidase [Microbulbifer thermotolerans]MCX2833242.1 aminopeptidase [Microbulbifer thermotolerans]